MDITQMNINIAAAAVMGDKQELVHYIFEIDRELGALHALRDIAAKELRRMDNDH
jgi:hypothetical protein